ncbi:MAG: uroporphyrinogen-III synthase [Gaiellales bacterium]
MTRVLVTRAREGAGRQAAWLRDAGFDAVVCPLVAVEPLAGGGADVTGYDWLILTSRTAVREATRRLAGVWPRVAVVGPGTAEALHDAGIEAALVPKRHSQDGLVEEFPRPAGRVLFAGAEGAQRLVVDALQAEFLALYRTVELRPVRLPDAELAVVSSGSAARSLAGVDAALPCVSTGARTSAVARESGLRVLAEAATADAAGVVGAVRVAASRLG